MIVEEKASVSKRVTVESSVDGGPQAIEMVRE